MECRLENKLKAMMEGLAREYQQEMAAAGALVDLEELTCQMGDMVARELTQREALDADEAECPDCGKVCPRGQPESVVLDGLRGEIAYHQLRYFYRRCRRSFFPLAAPLGVLVRATVTPSVLENMVSAGSNLGSYATAENGNRRSRRTGGGTEFGPTWACQEATGGCG